MGFVDYSVKFLKNKLELYESIYKNQAPQSAIHEAKVLLKLLDDIRYEGYENSYKHIDNACNAVERLNVFIASNNESPFVLKKHTVKSNIKYSSREHSLEKYIDVIEKEMKKPGLSLRTIPSIFYDIMSYGKDIFNNSSPDTAYCFLLRDTLLPYLAFKQWNKGNVINIYPLFISRKYFSLFEDKEGEIYSAIQDVIFESLDSNVETFVQLKDHIKHSLNINLKKYSNLFNSIKHILELIPQEKIMVIESGYIGTIPLLLSALDNRIDFRLFTTIPYFYELYKGKFYTDKFEKIREFETINCQDTLFQLSSISSDIGIFKVVETVSGKVKNKSYAELRTWNNLINSSTCKH